MRDNANRTMPTLSQVIGEGLRAMRAASRARQEDVALAARGAGLDWTRATVAAIENNRRALSIEEFLILPHVLADVTGEPVSLAELITTEWGAVELTERLVYEPADLRAMLVFVVARPWTPAERATEALVHALFTRPAREMLERVWPARSDAEYEAVAREAAGETERAAAAKLQLRPLALSALAHRLWGRGLSAERDRRVAELGEASSRTVQARRGHVTRRLLAELADAYPYPEGSGEPQQEVDHGAR
jgi:hypothetical protein